MEWSRQQVLRLVELYHSHPALWDITDTNFKNRDAKRWSLMSIASQLSLPPIDVEKKLHCLRTQFNREYLKMRTSARKPTWFAYQPLSFVLRNKPDGGYLEDLVQFKNEVKEELLDEYEPDETEIRLTIDENPQLTNMLIREHDKTANFDDSSNSNVIKAPPASKNNEEILSDNDIETSSPVEVILHESTNEYRHQNKRFCSNGSNILTTNNDTSSGYVNNLKKIHLKRYNTGSVTNNNRNSPVSTTDELSIFGKFLTDELLNVSDYYVLQLAKYEISKIIFKATTGAYENTNMTDHYQDSSKWKICKKSETRTALTENNRLSSVNELNTFSTVVINELHTIRNNYVLKVAKFNISQVLFHATTAGMGRAMEEPVSPKSPTMTTFNDDSPSVNLTSNTNDSSIVLTNDN